MRRVVPGAVFLAAILAVILAAAPLGAQSAPDPKLPITKSLTGYGLVVGNSYSFKMSLYNLATGGTPVWEELTGAIKLTGLTLPWTLGKKNPFSNGTAGEVDFSQQLYLQVACRLGGVWKPLGARTKFGMVPYALWSRLSESVAPGSITSEALADGAVTAAKIGESCAPGQVLFVKPGGGWECANIQPGFNGIVLAGSSGCTVSCVSGSGSCDSDGCNGCETDLTWDAQNCGACGNGCDVGQGCCNATCLSIMNDAQNCGGCGIVCPDATMTCGNGTCVCPQGADECDESCTNLWTDSQNCGACGMACPLGANCINGMCACPNGTTICEGACVFLASDPLNCGGCGVFCPSGICSAGLCLE